MENKKAVALNKAELLDVLESLESKNIKHTMIEILDAKSPETTELEAITRTVQEQNESWDAWKGERDAIIEETVINLILAHRERHPNEKILVCGGEIEFEDYEQYEVGVNVTGKAAYEAIGVPCVNLLDFQGNTGTFGVDDDDEDEYEAVQLEADCLILTDIEYAFGDHLHLYVELLLGDQRPAKIIMIERSGEGALSGPVKRLNIFPVISVYPDTHIALATKEAIENHLGKK